MTPANVLIWYDHDYGQLRSTLESLGHEVTTLATLPDDLSAYDVLWHVGAFRGVGARERELLISFLEAGGGLHLSGERPCCEPLNDSWTQLVNAVVRDGGITIGRQGDIFAITGSYTYPYPVNQEAKEDIADMPQRAEDLRLVAAGGIAGLASAANVVARGRRRDGAEVPVGAIWSSDDLVGGAGRLSVLMDVNWFSLLDNADNAAMVANLQVFLQGSESNHCPVARAAADRELACLSPGEETAITLDGTEARDADGDALTHVWYQDDREIARGPTPTVALAPGEHDIELVVSDGRCTSAPDTVHISLHADEEPPRLSLLGPDPAIVECGHDYVDPGAVAEDVCSGDLTADIVRTSNVDPGATGTYAITYEVTDDAGLQAQASRTVIVEDSRAPVVEENPPIVLWPPNHAHHELTLSDCVASIRDACDATLDASRAGRILWVSSNEPDDGTGDGSTQDDIVIVDDTTFRARAERQGHGQGRVYEVGFEVVDAAGNATVATCKVSVPHSP